MISMWNCLVPTVRAMNVTLIVSCTVVVGGAACRISATHANPVLVDVIALHIMQMTVVQIIDVTVVFDGDMAATGPMGMRVTLVLRARHVRSSRKVEFLSPHRGPALQGALRLKPPAKVNVLRG